MSNLGDITSFLGPIRALVLFYGGRRRQGDVAYFCELSIARRAVGGFRLIVCVVDIVHGPNHDISRGAANFFWGQVKAGRVAATGAAPRVKFSLSQDGQTWDGIVRPTLSLSDQPSSYGVDST